MFARLRGAFVALAVLGAPGILLAQDPPVEAAAEAVDPCVDAVSTQPEWSWLGAISARPGRELTRRSLEGIDATVLSRGVQRLRRAMTTPPVCPADAVALAALATALQDRIPLREAREALEDRVETHPDDGVARLWLARVAAAAGSPDAPTLAQAAIAAGADRTGAALAAARAAFAEGRDRPATAAYFQGLDAVTDGEALSGYIGDLGPVVRPDESREFGALDAEGQARWFARFWLTRAAESGVSVEERLAEHYRRVREAYTRFCGTCILEPAADPVIPYGRVGMGLDERGLVFLLQGEPDRVVETDGNELPPNASWVWQRGDDPLAVHFAVIDVATGWQIMEDPLAVVNPVRDPLATDSMDLPQRNPVRSCVVDGCEGRYVADFYRYLLDRGTFDPRFRTLANQYRSRPSDWGPTDVSGFVVGGPLSGQPSFRFEAEEDLAEIRARDVFAPGAFQVGEPALRVVAFRDADGATPAWLAVGGLWPDSAPVVGRVDATLRDPEGDAVVRGSGGGAPGAWSVPFVADGDGTRAVAVVLRDGPGEGAGILGSIHGTVDVAPPGDAFAVSDPVLWNGGGGEGEVARVDALARLQAVPRLTPGRPTGLYYEIYGLPPDQVFETRIRISRAEEGGVFRRLRSLFGGDDPSELIFRGETGRDPLAVRPRSLSLTLPDLDEGRYRLELEVRHRLVQVTRTLDFVVGG